MNLPKTDPDLAERLSENYMSPEGYGSMIHSLRTENGQLRRKVARLNNAIRLARTFSKEKQVQTILDNARGIE